MTHRRSPIARLVGLALVAGLVAVAPSWSSPASIARDDDDEEREIRRDLARKSFVENCLMCHGEDMTTRQRLTAKQWTTEVEKMVGWGAPLPPEHKQPLIDHLAEAYPSTQPPPPAGRINPGLALETQPAIGPLEGADPSRGEALFAAHCAVCHGPVARGGDQGTNLVEKPALIRVEGFRALIKEGRRKMPGFAAVLDDRAEGDLLAWLRRQK